MKPIRKLSKFSWPDIRDAINQLIDFSNSFVPGRSVGVLHKRTSRGVTSTAQSQRGVASVTASSSTVARWG